MKRVLMLLTVLCLSSCGYNSVNNEAIGQPKKIIRATPVFCPDYNAVDLSLGVMINIVSILLIKRRNY